MLLNIILFLFIFYITHSGYSKYKKINSKQLNGPLPIPILGNLHQLGKVPHLSMTALHDKYGPIYRLFFGDLYTVVVNDPVIIREMFVENNDVFIGRPKSPTIEYGTENYGISLSNEKWPKVRALVMNAIKRTNMKRVYDILDGKMDEMIKSMNKYSENKEPFEIHLYATRFTMSIMFKYIFNEDISFDEDLTKGKIADLTQPIDEIFKSLGAGQLCDYITILQPFYYWYLVFTDKSFKTVKKFINEKLQQHLDTIDKENPRDFLDLLIIEYSEMDKESIAHIIETVLDIFLAGFETTASSIMWFVLRMQDHTEIQEKAYQELISVIGDRKSVKLSDRPSTPLINAMIKEGLRMNPVGAFGLPHSSNKDITICNGKYFIPKNSQVLVNYKALFLNKEYFTNPEQYDPTRFLNKNNEAYIPFGVGERNCAGSGLANDEMYLAFSNIILNYKIINMGAPVDYTEESGLTLKPRKFKVILESRS